MNRTRIVIEQRSPLLRRSLQVAVVAAFIAAVFGAYEWGQVRAGYNRLEAVGAVAELEEQVQLQATEINELREREAILETAASVDQEAYSQVRAELVALQSQISELEENLEFYRGIVSPDDTKGVVKIQDLRISRGSNLNEYRVQVYLTQALRSDRPISGKVKLTLAGDIAGEAVEYALSELQADPLTPLSGDFRFRYFQEIAADIVLPAGFQPENLRVEARSGGKKPKTVEESFFWEIKEE